MNINDLKDNPILSSVLDKLLAQTQKGIDKYGNTVQADSLSIGEWINHAQEEIIDLLVYLETVKHKVTYIEESVKPIIYTQMQIDLDTGEIK